MESLCQMVNKQVLTDFIPVFEVGSVECIGGAGDDSSGDKGADIGDNDNDNPHDKQEDPDFDDEGGEPDMQIFVKKQFDDLKTITLFVNSSDTIHSVKYQVQGKEGIVARDQQLIFAGSDLENENTLAEYSIENESTIYLMIKLDGSGKRPHASGGGGVKKNHIE